METIGSDSSLLQPLLYCFSDRVDKVREEALALQLIQSPPASMRRGDHRATSASTSAAQLNSFGLVDAMTLVVKQLHKKHQRERLVREGGGGGGVIRQIYISLRIKTNCTQIIIICIYFLDSAWLRCSGIAEATRRVAPKHR